MFLQDTLYEMKNKSLTGYDLQNSLWDDQLSLHVKVTQLVFFFFLTFSKGRLKMFNEKTANLYQLAQKSAYTFFPLKKFGKKVRQSSFRV